MYSAAVPSQAVPSNGAVCRPRNLDYGVPPGLASADREGECAITAAEVSDCASEIIQSIYSVREGISRIRVRGKSSLSNRVWMRWVLHGSYHWWDLCLHAEVRQLNIWAFRDVSSPSCHKGMFPKRPRLTYRDTSVFPICVWRSDRVGIVFLAARQDDSRGERAMSD